MVTVDAYIGALLIHYFINLMTLFNHMLCWQVKDDSSNKSLINLQLLKIDCDCSYNKKYYIILNTSV